MQTNARETEPLAGISDAGCVQPYLEDFAEKLFTSGYTVLTTRDYVRSAAHLGTWADSRSLRLVQITEKTVAEFSRHSCECQGGRWRRHRPAPRYVSRVRRFVAFLQAEGVIPPPSTQVPVVVPGPLVGFREWMTIHRGAAPPTIKRYESLIGRMLTALGADPAEYDAALVRRVLLGEANQRSCAYAKTFATALRVFLRFLSSQGRCRAHLDRAVPTVPEWKLTALPRYLEAEDVERMLASCDLTTPLGIRDRAVLLLLVRLGLRAGDILAMRLGDLDWDEGTVRVRGKARREVRLPLPQDAGEALLEYLLHSRPETDIDRIFLCANAPVRAFATSASVSDIVCHALRRAGIASPMKGAHLLRHTAATMMLRSGASLDAIATVLRHESADTTAYYAKVDFELLQQIVQPWPEDATC